MKIEISAEMRVFKTHFQTTKWPKKMFLLGIVFFGADYSRLKYKFELTVSVKSLRFSLRILHIDHYDFLIR